MDRIDELKSLIENCKKTIESSEKEIEILKSKEPVFERVKKGKNYYSIETGATGKIEAHWRAECNTSYDIKYFKNNNYFHTEERAEEVADKINFFLKLERLHDTFCPDYKPNWNNQGESKFYTFYSVPNKKYQYNVCFCASHCPNIYFNSEETAKKVCEILNKEIENA